MNAKDISKVKTTYTNRLIENNTIIKNAFDDNNVSVEQFKSVILDSVKDAAETKAKIKFTQSVQKQADKRNLSELVYNTILRGSNMGSDINDKFNR